MSTRLIHGQQRVLNGGKKSTKRGDERQLPVGDPSTFPTEGGIDDSMHAIFDQLQAGSCTANAGAFLAAWLVWLRLSIVVVYARLFLYLMTEMFEGNALDDDAGAEPADVYRVLTNSGICDESLMPYTDDKSRWAPPSTQAGAAAAKHKADLWFECPSVEAIKQSLLDKFPVSFGITLYESFESNAVDDTGLVPNPDTSTEKPIGGHDMVIVYFDDNKPIPNASPGAFKVRNSWGKLWGVDGYCWISYDQWRSGNASECITLRREEM